MRTPVIRSELASVEIGSRRLGVYAALSVTPSCLAACLRLVVVDVSEEFQMRIRCTSALDCQLPVNLPVMWVMIQSPRA